MSDFVRVRLVLVLSLGFVAGACGDSRESPGGPSPVVAASTSSSASGHSTASGSFSNLQSAADTEGVEGEGQVTRLVAGTACPTLQFVVEGITLKTSAATAFEGGTCLDIKAGTKVEAKGIRQADGSVLASRIKIKQREIETVEGEGRVTSLVAGTACPTLQFVVEGITVKTNAATLYERGSCADLQPGVLVHVKGTSQADGTVGTVATLVRIQQNKVEGEGRIASLVSGTVCPALKFVVDTVTVTTDAATVYERGTCADLRPGVHVHVRGTRRENDTVIASLVRIQN